LTESKPSERTVRKRHRDVNRPADESRLTLLIDADDTLWENNIYFLEVTEHFLRSLERYGIDRAAARSALIETERRNIPVHGYGSRAFAMAVAEAFAALAPQDDPDAVEHLVTLANGIFERDQLELLEGVDQALEDLSRHHQLVLVTKGDPEEQERKLERSGLRRYFDYVEVVPEKDVDTYHQLVARLGLDPRRTWMVGNSPKSDINPALSAGLNAILVPHPMTWELEIEDVRGEADQLVVVHSFGEVAAIFVPAPKSNAD
jgi:putative hydrolase of the HAD superfamily